MILSRTWRWFPREMVMFKLLEHPADVRVSISGSSLAELFLSASQALWALWEPVTGEETGKKKLLLEGENLEELLVRFLSELIYLAQVRGLPQVEELKIEKESSVYQLEAEIKITRGCPGREIKAATYHGLKIVRKKGVYRCFLIFDV